MIRVFITTYPELIASFVGLLMVLTGGALGLYVRAIKNRIENHIDREEDLVWRKIDDKFTQIEDKFSTFQDRADERHTQLIQRLTAVESKIPNGELKRMSRLLQELVDRK